MNLNEKLIMLRQENDVTVQYLAALLSVSEEDIACFEDGSSEMSVKQIKQLALLYDVTVESLIDDDSDIVRNKKSVKRKLNGLKLVAKLLYFFVIGLTITYFMAYLSTVLLQKPSMRLIYGLEGEFIFPVVGLIGVLSLFLFIVLFSSKLATRLSKHTKGCGTEILVLLLLPFILLIAELFANLQASMLSKNAPSVYTIKFANMLVGSRAMVNGIAPLFIFALMISLVVKILDKTPYQPKLIQREHKVWHNFMALIFAFNLGTFSLPFYIAFKKEQVHICKGTKMGTFYTLGFIGSFWTTILSILGISLLAAIRAKLNF